jgi:hypothetical protein
MLPSWGAIDRNICRRVAVEVVSAWGAKGGMHSSNPHFCLLKGLGWFIDRAPSASAVVALAAAHSWHLFSQSTYLLYPCERRGQLLPFVPRLMHALRALQRSGC